MTDMKKPLPDFTNPPVVEVALSVQFDAIKKLRTPQLGLLWNEFKNDFPVTEEHPPLDAVFERFGMPPKPGRATVQFQMLDAPPIPRCWFLNNSGTELVQVQPDRFIHNWRKQGSQESYPRYETLRKTFAAELKRFEAFLQRDNIGSLSPNQCEVTYVNHVLLAAGSDHRRVDAILAPVSLRHTDDFLPDADDVRAALRYVIRNENAQPIGRLHVVAEPAYRTSDGQPMYVLTLTARGEPGGPTIDDALRFMDIGREWVVRGFAGVTTTEMHKTWGRTS